MHLPGFPPFHFRPHSNHFSFKLSSLSVDVMLPNPPVSSQPIFETISLMQLLTPALGHKLKLHHHPFRGPYICCISENWGDKALKWQVGKSAIILLSKFSILSKWSGGGTKSGRVESYPRKRVRQAREVDCKNWVANLKTVEAKTDNGKKVKTERLTKIEAKQTREACVTIGKFCEFQNCWHASKPSQLSFSIRGRA